MRFLGVDVGRKRIGLALSDATGLLARPWMTVPAGSTAVVSAGLIQARLADAGDPFDEASAVGAIVVGLPRRLDGSDNDETSHARALGAALGAGTGLDIHFQDERLTSREAEARLAEHEPDWRKRKAQIDAMAAAIILQDYLDTRRERAVPTESTRRW